MPQVSITITIDVPEGATVGVASVQAAPAEPDTAVVVPIVGKLIVTDDAPPPLPSGGARWSPEEEAVALDRTLTVAQVAERIGRPPAGVHAKRRKLGFEKLHDRTLDVDRYPRTMYRWTRLEAEFLADEWTGFNEDELSDVMDRSPGSIIAKVRHLGLPYTRQRDRAEKD